MIVLGFKTITSSLELLNEDYDLKAVAICSNEALILCQEKHSTNTTYLKLLSVKYNSDEDGENAPKEIEYFRNKNIVDLFGADTHAIVVEENGKVHSWGDNTHGQISTSEDDCQRSLFVNIPISIPLKSVVQVACGKSHTLFLLKTGELYALGNNTYGQLGIGSENDVSQPTRIDVPCLHGLPISQIVAGGWHSFCVTMSGRVLSWGRNDFGQLGLGTTKRHSSPQHLKDFSDNSVAFIAASEHHNAILTKHGELFTFGQDLYGQLGHGDDCGNELAPRKVRELLGSVVTQVSCGTNNTIAYVPNCDKIFVFGSCENREPGTSGNVAVLDPVMPRDDSQTNNINTVYRHGSLICNLIHLHSNIKPNDCRVVEKQRRIATLDEVCGKAELKSCEKADFISCLIEHASSFSCLNASFFWTDRMCDREFPAIDFDGMYRAASIMAENYNMSDEKSGSRFEKCLIENVLGVLNAEPHAVEALRFYIIFPALIEYIERILKDTSQIQNEVRYVSRHTVNMFIKKLTTLCLTDQKVLRKWYQSLSPDNFSLILDFYKHCLGDSLRCKNAETKQMLLGQLKMLNVINNVEQIVSFEEFYLADVSHDMLSQEYNDWRIKQIDNPLWKNYPFLLDAKAKCLLLEDQAKSRSNSIPQKVFEINKKDDIIEQVIKVFDNMTDLQRPLKVQFRGEMGIDDGALTKELFMLIFKELLKPRYKLFDEDKYSRFLWFNKDESTDSKKLYNIIGKLCGLGVYNSVVVDLNFPLVLYKKLLGLKTTLIDLKELDPTYGASLEQILSFVEDDEMTMEDVFGSFTTADGVPLKEGGDEIPITVANREEYVELYVKYLLDVSVQPQFEAFSSGFLAVFAKDDIILKLFRPEELMKTVRGTQNYDWKELQKHTVYENFKPGDEIIVWFWEVLFSMTKEEKLKFLVYLTGSNTIPISGLKMVISKREECDEFLPFASVCYNTLQLHLYSSKDILKERLLKAIDCKGFHSI